MEWKDFRNLSAIKNLTENEQARKYFMRITDEIYDFAYQKNMSASGSPGGIANDALPEEFYIAGLINDSRLIYLTDDFRYLDLEQFLTGVNVTDINEIVRNDTDLYLSANFGLPTAFVVKLVGCELKNNELVFKDIKYNAVSGSINYIHGMIYYRDFLYLCSREYSTSPVICKIDPETMGILKTFTVPITGGTTDIIGYDGELYILTNVNSASTTTLSKIDLDLNTRTTVLTTGTSSSPSRRVRIRSAFLIYQNEIFIPIVNNTGTGYNEIGMEVYDKNGTLLRSIYNQPINTGGANAVPYPHWMSAKDGKLMISLSIASATTSNKCFARMNISTLAVEESIPMDMLVTDDNSVFSDGYMYINGENTIYSSGAKLVKIKFDDFSDYTVLIGTSEWGDGSYGSINPVYNP